MPLSMCTVTGGPGGWTNPDGSAASGQVTLRPVDDAPGGGYIVVARSVTVALTAGNISKALINNSQAISLQYLVTEQIDGCSTISYVVTLVGSTLDLSSAPRGQVGVTTPIYILASTVGQPGGPAGPLDGAGRVPLSQLPSGSGVLSVTPLDATITVGGTGTAPTVGVNTIPEAKVTGLTTDLGTLAAAASAASSAAAAAQATASSASAAASTAQSTATSAAAAASAAQSTADAAVPKSIVTTKGDLFVATGPGTLVRVGAGSDGHILTADAASAAGVKWAAADTGSAQMAVRRAFVTSGDLPIPDTGGGWPGGTWVPLTGLAELVVPAAIGDYIEASYNCLREGIQSWSMDLAVVTGGGPTIQRYLSTGSGTPAVAGDPGGYPGDASTFLGHPGALGFIVEAGDLDGGNVRIAVVVMGSGAGTRSIRATANYPFYRQVKNHGPVS